MALSTESRDQIRFILTRRRFLKYLLGFSIVATLAEILIPVISYLWPPEQAEAGGGGRVQVGTVEDFPAGAGRIVPVNNKPVIVVNTPQGLKAFSAICTHLGCIVLEKEPGQEYILCPCHDGRFSPVTGQVIGGPPPRPLPEYELSVEDGKVFIGKPLGQLYGG